MYLVVPRYPCGLVVSSWLLNSHLRYPAHRARTRFSYCLSTCMLRLFWEVIDFNALESMPSQSIVWPQEGLSHSRFFTFLAATQRIMACISTIPSISIPTVPPLHPSPSHPSASISFIHSLHPSASPNNLPSQPPSSPYKNTAQCPPPSQQPP